jgi:hypothetical protein
MVCVLTGVQGNVGVVGFVRPPRQDALGVPRVLLVLVLVVLLVVHFFMFMFLFLRVRVRVRVRV